MLFCPAHFQRTVGIAIKFPKNGTFLRREIIHQPDMKHLPSSFTGPGVFNWSLFFPRTIPLSFTHGVQMTSLY